MSQPLKGKVALVTGGGKNLGGLISRSMADAGAAVAVHYNSPGSKKSAEETVSEIETKGGQAAAFQADMTKPAGICPNMRDWQGIEVKKLFEDVVKTFEQVNIAVNCVGKVLKKPITETSEEEYDEMYVSCIRGQLMVGLRSIPKQRISLSKKRRCISSPTRTAK